MCRTVLLLLLLVGHKERLAGTPVLDATTWGSLTTCDTLQIVGPIIIDEPVHKNCSFFVRAVASAGGRQRTAGAERGEVSSGRGGHHPAAHNLPSGEAVQTGKATVDRVKLHVQSSQLFKGILRS